jgi:hypothetical protein
MKLIKNKPIVILIALAGIISIGLTVYHGRYLFEPAPDYEELGYVQVEATITRVYLSGQRWHMKTRLTLQYEYEGETYTAVRELGGNSEGYYNVGDTIKQYLDPANPGKLY